MTNKKDLILKEALKIVPFDGWSQKTLAAAARDAGLEPGYEEIAFPQGISELVAYFLAHLDEEMANRLNDENIISLKVRERVTKAVKTRLLVAEKYKLAIHKTVAFFAMPQNSIQATKSLWHTVDKIWYIAGDKSADFNHYTKRIMLAGVYSSTLLYWLADKSDDHSKTWEFLDRRIGNVMQINTLKDKVSRLWKQG